MRMVDCKVYRPLIYLFILFKINIFYLFFWNADKWNAEYCWLDVSFLASALHIFQGIMHNTKPVFTAQFHPEAKGGPTDTEVIKDFDSAAESTWMLC